MFKLKKNRKKNTFTDIDDALYGLQKKKTEKT